MGSVGQGTEGNDRMLATLPSLLSNSYVADAGTIQSETLTSLV